MISADKALIRRQLKPAPRAAASCVASRPARRPSFCGKWPLMDTHVNSSASRTVFSS